MSEHDPEPLIYAAWVAGADSGGWRWTNSGRWPRRCRRPTRCFSNGCTATSTARASGATWSRPRRVETCVEMARLALDDALLELSERYGPRLESWRWGDAHQALHRHQTLGARSRCCGRWSTSRQSTPGGDDTLMRGQMPGIGAGALSQHPRGGVSRGLRLLRPGFERLHHLDRPERAPAVAPLRRSVGAVAARRIHPDVARRRSRPGRRDRHHAIRARDVGCARKRARVRLHANA